MATTSPDNIRTPDPGSPYNLVTDLATLAGDVQSALNTRANVYKGTTTQRTSFTSTAVPGMLWQDTNGIGMLWKRGASAWEPAVWRWSGTTTQMNSFTQAPNGFEWFDTSTNARYVRISGAWKPSRLSGSVTFSSSLSTVASQQVTFSTPFSEIPSVTIGAVQNLGRLGAFVSALSETGFYLNVFVTTGSSFTPGVILWQAQV